MHHDIHNIGAMQHARSTLVPHDNNLVLRAPWRNPENTPVFPFSTPLIGAMKTGKIVFKTQNLHTYTFINIECLSNGDDVHYPDSSRESEWISKTEEQ